MFNYVNWLKTKGEIPLISRHQSQAHLLSEAVPRQIDTTALLAEVLALALPHDRRLALASNLQNLLRAKRLPEVRQLLAYLAAHQLLARQGQALGPTDLLGHQRNPTAFVLEVYALCHELQQGRVHVAARP
ncbi:MAG: hypothetical protein MUC97_01975 [Bernardetiaceae bacterium]|nr:hypothetical protein [Bernardetiaceae bacterium]